MPKSLRLARRRRATDLRARTAGPDTLLDRILDTPHLAHVVPRLPPEVLHRIIQSCGLEDCGELLTLATPDQLARVFDVDLWRAGQPGLDEQFDADRFGVWLEVLVESDATVAAHTLAAMDVDLVIAALAQHARVFDRAAILLPAPDGEEVNTVGSVDDGPSCDVGGYLVVARRSGSWNAIVTALASLDADHSEYFHRVMRGCTSLSNSRPEIDGLHDLLTDREQAMFNLALVREQRRDHQGFVTPAQARAFLQMSRQPRLGDDATPSGNPVARAYFRAIESTTPEDANHGSSRLLEASGATPSPEESADAVAGLVEALIEAAIVPQQPRALLEGPQRDGCRLARIRAHMQFAHDCDLTAYSIRSQELAYLANAIVAGCSIQARPFTPQEASDAAAAVCNLGLENWPVLPLPDDFLVGHDLVSVFQVGWTVLHENVCMYTADRLIRILARLRCEDRETQAGLNVLRIEMAKHWRAGVPWRAREALDVIAILDTPAWAALLALIDECPVMHAAVAASRSARTRSVSATGFEFISENSQIASVHEFVQALPEMLRP